MLKVLHVWDQSSTASVMAKWQRKIGYRATVIKNAKHDKLESTKHYKGVVVNSKIKFVLKTILLAKNYDVIHLHDAWFVILPIRILFPKKKLIIHYHGSLIRRKMKESRRKIWEKFVDVILVSTPDLLDYDYYIKPIYIPNPVDVELFNDTYRKNNGKCLINLKKDQMVSMTEAMLLDHGIDVNLHTSIPTLYNEFPDTLRQYEYYADLPWVDGKMVSANSMCGLQAMAMGIKTIQYDFTIKDSLPEEHHPENVVKRLDEIYNQ